MPMNWIYGLMGFLAGGLLIGAWIHRKHSQLVSDKARLETQTLGLSQSLTDTKNALASEKTETHTLREQCQALLTLKTQLETQLENTQKQAAQWQASLEKLWEDKFSVLSTKTLNHVSEQLAQKAKEEYATRQTLLNKDLTALLEPMAKLVKDQEVKVKELGEQTLKETTSLKKHLELSFEQTKELIHAKNRIVTVLTDNKGRGDWGELQLIRLLELSGLIKDRDYVFQPVQAGDTRPDIQVNLPNGHILYIDVKTLIGKLESLEVPEDTAVTDEERKKRCTALRKEILSLNTKAYQTKERASVDFVILYVPRESMLRIPLEEFPTLLDEAFERGVILSSPLILMGLLKTVAQGWANAQVADNAREIVDMGKELHKRAGTFLERFEDIETALSSLSDRYANAKRAFTGLQGFVPQVNKLEKLGAKSVKMLPPQYRLTQTLETSDGLTTLDITPSERSASSAPLLQDYDEPTAAVASSWGSPEQRPEGV